MGVRPAIKGLMIANLVVFFIQQGFELGGQRALGAPTAFDRLFWLDRDSVLAMPFLEFYRIVSYQFLHGDMWHFVMNMLVLWVFGNGVHDRLGFRGFLILYFGAGCFGGLIHLLLTASPVVGASGAIYGIMIFFAILHPNAPIIFFIVRMKVKWLVTFFVVADLLRFLSPNQQGISVGAHLGGAAFGAVAFFGVHRYSGAGRRLQEKLVQKVERRKAQKDREQKEVVDDILAKVSEEGISALTDKERRVLTQASKRYKSRS